MKIPSWALLAALVASPAPGLAQPSPPSPDPAGASSPAAQDVSPDELRAIQKALGTPEPAAPPGAPTSAPSRIVTSAGSGGYALNASVLLDTAVAWFSSEDVLPQGGHDPAGRGFHLRQLEISLYANADPFFRFDANLVVGMEGFELEEAYGTTLGLPAGLQLRAGRFLLPFGRINRRHPHQWAFEDAPLVLPKFFGPDGARGLGVELSWLAPTPWFMKWTLSANRRAGPCCARSFGPPATEDDPDAAQAPIDGLEDFLYVANLQQFWTLGEDWGLMWGLSAMAGPNGTAGKLGTVVAGTDLLLRWRPVASSELTWVAWQTEVLWRGRDLDTGHPLREFGGYSQLVWRMTRRWAVAGRFDWVQGLEGDPLDPEWTRDRMRASADVTFMPTHFSRIRIQGDADVPRWRDKPVWAAIVGLELGVGAHAAHDF